MTDEEMIVAPKWSPASRGRMSRKWSGI